MAQQRRSNGRPRSSRRADLEAKLKRLNADLKDIVDQLESAPPEDATRRQSADAIRRRESLRRRRVSLMMDIDMTRDSLHRAKQPAGGGERVVQGPKGGVYSVIQGGSPGLGKRK